MKQKYLAVRPAGSDEWKWATIIVRIAHTQCSLPSGREGLLNGSLFKFKELTLAEYESYIEMDVLLDQPSDDFVIGFENPVLIDTANQAAYELNELDDVFSQPK